MSGFSIDDLLSKAEKTLQNINISELPTGTPASEQLTDYAPEVFTGSIYDEPVEYELSVDDISAVMNSEDYIAPVDSAFVESINVIDKNAGIASATIRSETDQSVDIIAANSIEGEATSELADLDQVIDFALRQAAAIQSKHKTDVNESLPTFGSAVEPTEIKQASSESESPEKKEPSKQETTSSIVGDNLVEGAIYKAPDNTEKEQTSIKIIPEVNETNELPEGIVKLTEEDIYYSNSGYELTRYPKEFAKPITTAKKRIEWFLENIGQSGDKESELLAEIEVLKNEPVDNFEKIYKLGCIKLFGNEHGVPTVNRKKTAAELKQEKEIAEQMERKKLLEKAMERVKSKDDIDKANEEKNRISEILSSVVNASTQTVEDLIGKQDKHENDKITPLSFNMDAPEVSEKQVGNNIEKPTVPDVTGQQFFNAYFAIVKGSERLAMGSGRYISNEQITSIAETEGAIVLWAASQSSLEVAVNKLIKETEVKPATDLSVPPIELSSTPKIINEKPAQAISEQSRINMFDAEVERAIKVMGESLEVHKLIKSSNQSESDSKPALPHNVNSPVVFKDRKDDLIENPNNKSEEKSTENRFKTLPEKVQDKINLILEKLNSKGDPNADCNFYRFKKQGRFPEIAVLAVSRNLSTNQVKFYTISESEGNLKMDQSITKVELARMIAQAELEEIDVSDKKVSLSECERTDNGLSDDAAEGCAKTSSISMSN